MANDISLDDLMQKSNLSSSSSLTPLNLETEIANVGAQVDQLSAEDRQKVEEIKSSIDLSDSQLTVQYGVGAQKNLTTYADTILKKVQTGNAGEVGAMMSDLLTNVESLEIAEIGAKDDGFFDKLFSPISKRIKKFMQKYNTVETNISRIETQLDKARMGMLKDISMFDQLYDQNLKYYKDLQLYIKAGEEVVEEMRTVTLPKLRAEAEANGEQMAAQVVNDFANTVDRFEKKVHDLKISKPIALQTAPQIRMIQNNDKVLVDKIQTTIVNTIPLWKSQIVIALGLQNQQKVLQMQQEINKTTNDLLIKNSELLKQNTIDVATESERGIVEIETLKKVNQDLIDTINETIRIQNDGRAKRAQAEKDLVVIENQLRDTMLAAGRNASGGSQQPAGGQQRFKDAGADPEPLV